VVNKLSDVELDKRALELVRFKDAAGNTFALHQSSQRSAPMLFIRQAVLSRSERRDMLLDRELAVAMVSHLQAWVETGSLVLEET
jgi:hypothetical protein